MHRTCLTNRVTEIVLIRHGETEWSAAHRHTSYTDLGLSPDGEQEARAVRDQLAGRAFTAVLASPGPGRCAPPNSPA